MSSKQMPPPPEDFAHAVATAKSHPGYPTKPNPDDPDGPKVLAEPDAWALGFATQQNGVITDVFFPPPYGNVKTNYGSFALLFEATYRLSDDPNAPSFIDVDSLRRHILPRFTWTKQEPWNAWPHDNVEAMEWVTDVVENAKLTYGRELIPVLVWIDDLMSEPAFGMLEARLRLTLMSGGHVTLEQITLKNIFTQLKRTLWTTNDGVFDGSKKAVSAIRRKMQREGKTLSVKLLDKFPYLTDYIDLGDDIRIAGFVRLGAYLGPGTTVMASGTVNFGAYVEGPNMIEGRVPIGSKIGKGTDVGGAASIMGTTSGGNDITSDVGEDSLLEAMSGLGIPIGNRVRIEAGFYTKSTVPFWVDLYDKGWDGNEVIEALRAQHPAPAPAGEGPTNFDGQIRVKAIELAGISDAIFRRDADTGRPVVVPRGDHTWGTLNPVLHGSPASTARKVGATVLHRSLPFSPLTMMEQDELND